MTKSTITREQLEEWVAQFDEDGGCDATDRQLEALIRQSLAALDSEPVAEVVSIYGDPEAFGEREIRPLIGIQQMPYGTKLYRHAQPAPASPVCTCPSGDGSLRWPCPVHAGNSLVIPDGSASMLRRWLAFGRAMQNAGCQLPHNLIAETEAMLAAATQEAINALIPLVSRNEQEGK
ncbi:hypothetical protein AB0134_11000 [Klebsiella pneumoniae]